MPVWFPLLLVAISAALVFVSFVALDFLGNKAVLAIYAGAAVLMFLIIIVRWARSE